MKPARLRLESKIGLEPGGHRYKSCLSKERNGKYLEFVAIYDGALNALNLTPR